MIDVRKLLEQGQAVLDQEHQDKEATKAGTLRIGSVGAVSEDGEVFGECHRIALARMLGVDKKVDAPRKIMFASGNANEDIWYEIIRRSWKGKVLREEEVPVTWEVPETGVKVLGRPDMVLADESGTPVHGLEHKGVFSLSTAKSVEMEGKPQDKHVIQAAAYSLFLGIPFTLCYTNPSVIDLQFDRKKYGIDKIQPFYRMFYLNWEGDELFYKDEHSADRVKTPITKQGIQDFYKLITEMRDKKRLGPRPAKTNMDGSKMYWDRCSSKYCAFADSCDRHETNYDNWVKSLTE